MKIKSTLALAIAFASLSTFTNAQDTRTIKAWNGTPEIDGKVDEAWKNVPKGSTDRHCSTESSAGPDNAASAKFQCMWDKKNLYVLAVVSDSRLSSEGFEDWQQDSVEVFIDQNMARATSYQDDDAQFRVNCDGDVSYGPSTATDIKAASTKTDSGYIVEMAIPLNSIVAADGTKIGFEVQVNDDSDGSGTRSCVMKWNDDTNDSWQDTSAFGTLVMATSKDAAESKKDK